MQWEISYGHIHFGSTAPTFDEYGLDIVINDSNIIYLTGIYRNSIEIDPSEATINLITN